MDPKTELAAQVIHRALKSGDYSEKESREIAFHLTDWIDDLKAFVDFLENPNRFKDDEVLELIIKLLAHAPDHLKIAAEHALNPE